MGSRTDERTDIVCSLNNRKFAEADTRYTRFVIVVIVLTMYLTLQCYHFFTAYNSGTQVRQSFYPSASANELKVHGHQALFFPAKKVKSCEAHRPAAKSYEIFMPQLKRRGTLVQEKQVKIKGLKLDR